MTGMIKNALKIAGYLFLIHGLIWLGIAANHFSKLNTGQAGAAILGLLTAGNAAVMILCGAGLIKNYKIAYFFALPFVAINILLTFTDQFGCLDLGTLAIDLFILAFLLIGRRNFGSGAG